MVDTVYRTCIKEWELTDDANKTFKLVVGKDYTTSECIKNCNITVFSNYWVNVPQECLSDPLTDKEALDRRTNRQRQKVFEHMNEPMYDGLNNLGIKGHKIAEHVTKLTEIGNAFANTGQMRQHMSRFVIQLLQEQAEALSVNKDSK